MSGEADKMSLREKILGRTGIKVKTLGFGGIPIQRVSEKEAVKVVRRCYELGINYYDTARGYTVSEERIGKALEDVRRKVVLATKTHALTKEEALKDLEISLANLRTDYIDVYQLHGVSSEESWEKIVAPNGALDALYQAKKDGRTRHIGITSHNIQLLRQIIGENIFETIMVQLNYLAPEPAEELLPLCHRMGVGVVIMKPFAGGTLSNASTALKYVLGVKNVDVAVPGMMDVVEVEKNVAAASGTYTLTRKEKKLMEKDMAELGEHFCRGCDYCQPCPQSIPISSILRAESFVKRMGLIPRIEKQLQEGVTKASGCIECGQCETKCPYHLPIRELLKDRRKYIVDLLESGK